MHFDKNVLIIDTITYKIKIIMKKVMIPTRNLILVSIQIIQVNPEDICTGTAVHNNINVDLIPEGMPAINYVREQVPQLNEAIDEFLEWYKEEKIDLMTKYSLVISKIDEIIKNRQLAEKYPLPTRRSVHFYLSLLSYGVNYPEYPYDKVIEACQEDFPGLPVEMLPYAVEKMLPKLPLWEVAEKIRGWFSDHEYPQERGERYRWMFEFLEYSNNLIREYQLPSLIDL